MTTFCRVESNNDSGVEAVQLRCRDRYHIAWVNTTIHYPAAPRGKAQRCCFVINWKVCLNLVIYNTKRQTGRRKVSSPGDTR